MKKIIGIGNALVDVMTMLDDDLHLEEFGLPKGSMQLVDTIKSDIIKSRTAGLKSTLTSGGSAANTIHGLAMTGAETRFIGSIGNDRHGLIFEKDMQKAGVDTCLIRRESSTGTAIALISPDSERTFATHLGAAIELEASDITAELFRGYDILYLEGYLIINKPLVHKACIIAKECNMEIALDMASYNVVESHRDAFAEIIEKYVDIVFANDDEARAFTSENPDAALKSLSGMCDTAIVKMGPDGSLIKKGNEAIAVKPMSVDVRDTTGAGDLYAAGFLYGYARGEDLEKCGRYGSIMAGNVIEIIGARMDEPRWKRVLGEIRAEGESGG